MAGKKKLLIITGAGASVEFGMHSVGKVDLLFEDWAKRMMPLADDPDRSLYTFIKTQVLEYYSRAAKPKSTNFEELLYIINILQAIYSDDEYRYPLNSFLAKIELPEIILFGNRKRADGIDLKLLHSHLVDSLLDDFRKLCIGLTSTKSSELNTVKLFLEKLSDEFDIAVVTVNYDDIILQALPSLDTGFDSDGRFDYTNVLGNMWSFYYSLHGSVHFDMKLPKGNGSLHEIAWESNLSNTFQQNSSGRNTITTMEGLHLLTSNIIAGYDKSNQILRDPFKTYFCQIPDLIDEADCYLFCGYGFADRHLNSHLENVRGNGPVKKIVILDYADDQEDPLQFRQDEWSYKMCEALIVNPGKMGSRTGGAAPSIGALKANNEFEISHDPERPLAIWYGGFLNACNHVNKVIDELL